MCDVLKEFDALKILIWLVPGTFIALFRSFAMRGAFPAVGKDDVSALILGSIIYWFLLVLLVVSANQPALDLRGDLSGWSGFILLFAIPAVVGFGLGYLEASDGVGILLRRAGIRLPSPETTAWETMFREMKSGSVIIVTLKDGATVFGEWIGERRGSVSSSDPSSKDLYLGRIGTIGIDGLYWPHTPVRGAYIAGDQIRTMEVIAG